MVDADSTTRPILLHLLPSRATSHIDVHFGGANVLTRHSRPGRHLQTSTGPNHGAHGRSYAECAKQNVGEALLATLGHEIRNVWQSSFSYHQRRMLRPERGAGQDIVTTRIPHKCRTDPLVVALPEAER